MMFVHSGNQQDRQYLHSRAKTRERERLRRGGPAADSKFRGCLHHVVSAKKALRSPPVPRHGLAGFRQVDRDVVFSLGVQRGATTGPLRARTGSKWIWRGDTKGDALERGAVFTMRPKEGPGSMLVLLTATSSRGGEQLFLRMRTNISIFRAQVKAGKLPSDPTTTGSPPSQREKGEN